LPLYHENIIIGLSAKESVQIPYPAFTELKIPALNYVEVDIPLKPGLY
jgi:hypothetical protein